MTRINLLPTEERAKAAREQGIALAILALVVLVVILGGVYLLSYRQVGPKQTQIDNVNAQINQANMQLAALRPYEVMQTQTNAMDATALQLYDSRVLMSSILEEVSLLIPDDVSLTGMSIVVPPVMIAGSGIGTAGGSVSTSTSTVDVKFNGTCKDVSQVAEFMTRLGLMPQLQHITLLNAGTTSGSQYFTFEIDAGLRPFETPPPQAVGSGGGGQ